MIGCHHVRITGATGKNAGDINGVYKATNEMYGNVTAYEGEMCLLEYENTLKSWLVTDGTTAKAFCTVPAKCLPEECPTGRWFVFDTVLAAGSMYVPQRTITVSLHADDSKTAAAAMKVDAGPTGKTAGVGIATSAGSGGVRITGEAMGKINGVYEATNQMSGGMPVYVKVGFNDMCMEYRAHHRTWQLKAIDLIGTDVCSASCTVPVKCLPAQCPVGHWYVGITGHDAVPQPAVTISPVSNVELEAYREEQKEKLLTR